MTVIRGFIVIAQFLGDDHMEVDVGHDGNRVFFSEKKATDHCAAMIQAHSDFNFTVEYIDVVTD